MAHNSLFAILLRSRWWISIALAALVTLVSTALLPKDIAPFAAITALPFSVSYTHLTLPTILLV